VDNCRAARRLTQLVIHSNPRRLTSRSLRYAEDMKPYGSLNNYISKHRKMSGLSVQELADLLDVHRNKIAAFEDQAAMPTLVQAIALELIFHEPVQQMFAGVSQQMRVLIAARARHLLSRQEDQTTTENAGKLEILGSLAHIDEEEFTPWSDAA
jgi:DNA-binding XRE family transcriptional regulator